MTEVLSWSQARAAARRRMEHPDEFTGEGELAPPCREACKLAMRWGDDMQRDGNHSRLIPTSIENGPNGDIHIAGKGWHMHFWERESEVANG